MISGCSRTRANSSRVSARGLVQDAVGDRELADVVQQGRAAQVVEEGLVAPERLAMLIAITHVRSEWR